SLVQLAPGTVYEIQLGMPGQAPSVQLNAATWYDTTNWTIAREAEMPSGSQTLAITEGGSPNAYVVYKPAANGGVIDVANVADYAVTVSAPYVIVRGLTLKGARVDGLRLLNGAHDVVIENADISDWGSFRTTLAN